jgi:RNA polymerase sigma factor (sigma-70 family)
LGVSNSLSLELLFRDHHRWLVGRLLRHADDAHDAQDICSETFVQVMTGKTDPATIEHPRAFLVKIGQRVLYRRHRERELEARILDALAAGAAQTTLTTEEVVMMAQAISQLDEALFGLPVVVREAFLYSQLDGMAYEDIAQRMHVSVRTVARYVKQALLCCWNNGYF